ncbi:MAG: NAD(P)-dependent oxidoreductase [Candidatus Helarchaeota archaeon]|nr:NAD(P)-dependent oxidoreductase [Candidatus Helarchaeota archaeon]NVM55152.1 NAD(P)-dependent oxidoreductase [Candidatus Helarchaeota archaeon]
MVKTALVTGAAGHCGTFMVRILREKGYNVIATDLTKAERDELFLGGKWTADDEFMKELLGEFEFVTADLTDKESLKPLFEHDIDVVFSIASLYDYFAHIDVLRKINVDGVRNLAELVLEKGSVKHFLQWSTCGVYGQPKYKKDKKGYPLPTDETVPYKPPNAYSVSKMEQEHMLFKLHRDRGLPLTVIRPAPIYGPYQTYGAFHMFNLLHKLGMCVVPSIYPRKKRLRIPMVHVKDLARAALHIYEYQPKEKTIGEAYNLVCDEGFQDDFIEFCCETLNVGYKRIPIWWPMYIMGARMGMLFARIQERRARKRGLRPRFEASMAGYVHHQYYFSNQKIKDLGFKFEYEGWKKGTLETINWYREMGWLEDDIE